VGRLDPTKERELIMTKRKAKPRKCSRCGHYGHNKATCTHPVKSSAISLAEQEKISANLTDALNEAMKVIGGDHDPCRPTLCIDLHGVLFIEETQDVTGEKALGACLFYIRKRAN